MLRRLLSTVLQTRGFKQQAKINWVKPEYVPAYKPEKSGDLEALPPIPETSIGLDYSLTEEIKDAPESVKKLFSVDFLGRKEFNTLVRKDLVDRVRRHKYDEATAETKIAKLTASIRVLQYNMELFPRNRKAKVTVQQMIDKRKRYLKFLRQYDYQKFEWILEKLNVEYKGYPEIPTSLTRKESLRRLTELHCEQVRGRKLDEYRTLLESQQGPYLTDKLAALKFIRSEQMELQLPITVTEKDIDQLAKQLDEWKIKDDIKKDSKRKKRSVAIEID